MLVLLINYVDIDALSLTYILNNLLPPPRITRRQARLRKTITNPMIKNSPLLPDRSVVHDNPPLLLR